MIEELHEALRTLQPILFGLLGLSALLNWRRTRSRPAAWLAATFGTLAAVVLISRFVPTAGHGPVIEFQRKVVLSLAALAPYFLFHFMRAFGRKRLWIDIVAATLTAAALVAPFLFHRIPTRSEVRPLLFREYLILLALQWGFLLVSVATGLWRSGEEQPTVSRRRMRLLSMGSVALVIAIVLVASQPGGGRIGLVDIMIALLGISSVPLFYLGFAPPLLLRLAWRRPEERGLRQAELGLMTTSTIQQVAAVILPHAAALLGGKGAALFDKRHEICGLYSMETARAEEIKELLGKQELSVPGERGFVAIPMMNGWLAVENSVYTPFFGKEEQAILESLAVTTDLAMGRVLSYLAEQRRSRYLDLLQAVASAANSADRIEDAITEALKQVCEKAGWTVGHAYLTNGRAIKPTGIWHFDQAERFDRFKTITEQMDMIPGKGLAGIAYSGAETMWVEDIHSHQDFLRREGDEDRVLKSAVIVPIISKGNVIGTLEFFSKDLVVREDQQAEVLNLVANNLSRVHERTTAESELLERAEQLARSNAELEQFAYVASHDLQEPLRMVGSYVQLLAENYEGKIDESADNYIRYAVEGASRMQALIQDLLTLSRVSTRGRDLEPTDSQKVLESVLHDLQMTIQEGGAWITSQPDLPVVLADPTQLAQLFQNLVANAIKFKGDDPIRVDISAVERPGEWEFMVKDNGIGIDPKYFDRIFTIFQRLHTRTEYAGTGIGLSICKKIVERHNGRIWVESSPGQGAVFHFTLPKAKERSL